MSRVRFALVVGLLSVLMLAGSSSDAAAHNSDIATFVVHRSQGGVWLVEVHLSTVGLNRALERRTGKRASELSPEEYRRQAVSELREGLVLVADDQLLTPGKAGVRLGSHDSSVFFGLPDAPEQIAELWGSQISALSTVDNQHNVLRLVTPEGSRQWVLAERNDFTMVRPGSEPEASGPAVSGPPGAPSRRGTSLGWAWGLLALATGFAAALLAPRRASRGARGSLA